MATGQAGFNCNLYVNADKVTEATDVTVSVKRGEIEDTARDTNGWRSYISGLGDWTITFKVISKRPWGTALSAIETAFNANTIVTGVKVEDDEGYGISGSVAVTDMSEEQPFEGVVTRSFTLKGRGQPTSVTPGS